MAAAAPATRTRSPRWPAVAGALCLLLLAGAWVAGSALWSTAVPSGLRLPSVSARSLFGASYLKQASSYEDFLYIDALLATVAVIAVLAVYARRGVRMMRESAAGRIGTGMLLGMLAFGFVWLAELPFELAAVWWERRHGVSHQSYGAAILEGFLGLGSRFLFISLALLVAMGIAGLTRRWWWAVAAPVFAALALLSVFVSPYLIGATHPLRDPATLADARALARTEGVPGTKFVVQEVSRYTTAPNAEATGFGPTRHVILWDTLLDGRFSRREVRVVIAHELGHIAADHPLRGVGWALLFLIPASALVALATARRGGLARPEAVPLAVLVFVLLQFAAVPLQNVVSRHVEAEADWRALNATRDPAAARALFVTLARTSHEDPSPPAWAYVLYENHPTIVQRVAMVQAWEQRSGGR